MSDDIKHDQVYLALKLDFPEDANECSDLVRILNKKMASTPEVVLIPWDGPQLFVGGRMDIFVPDSDVAGSSIFGRKGLYITHLNYDKTVNKSEGSCDVAFFYLGHKSYVGYETKQTIEVVEYDNNFVRQLVLVGGLVAYKTLDPKDFGMQ